MLMIIVIIKTTIYSISDNNTLTKSYVIIFFSNFVEEDIGVYRNKINFPRYEIRAKVGF